MILQQTFDCDIAFDILKAYHCNLPDVLFFDIETTGFSPKNSSVYLIGAVYYDTAADTFVLRQWFDESGHQQKQMVSDFMQFASGYAVLIHFNGDGFDLPYLKETCQREELPYTLSTLHSFDIYKTARACQSFLALSHMKQKDIEHFLHIEREDKMSGGELINVYKTYVKTPTNNAQKLLLLHNADDLKGLTQILPILAYSLLLAGHFTVADITVDTSVSFHLNLPYALKNRLSMGSHNILLTAYQNQATLCVPAYRGELKYFYPNYKDYYYLPVEDTAIHKSVASYVDKEYRVKAHAANCYSRKTGVFLPQPEPLITPCFQMEYKDKTSYFEVTDAQLKNPDAMNEYVKCMINGLKKAKA